MANDITKHKKEELMLPGDNAKFLQHNMELAALPPIDTSSDEQVAQRAKDYFEICGKNDMRPSVAGLALAYGVDRMTIWRWANDRASSLSDTARCVIKKAYVILNAQMEDYMQNGKINPISGIFLMKNNMGYEDKKEITVQPPTPLGDSVPSEELQKKYLDAVDDGKPTDE